MMKDTQSKHGASQQHDPQPQRGSKGGSVAIELILTVVTIAAICLLPTLYLYWRNLGDLHLKDLMGSVYLFFGIGIVLFAVLRLIFRKRPYFAGLLTTLILFLVVNFSLISALPKQIFADYLVANIISIVVVILLIVGGVFLFRALCKQESTGRSVMLVLCIVFVGLIAFNGVQTALTNKTAEAAPTAKPTQVAEVTPTPEPETEEIIVTDETPAPTEEATPEPTEEPTPTPVPKTKTPNIYLLVLDEYASMGAMEKYYNYDCTAMRDFLRSAGINWSEYSYSMTRETKYCMTDLNMMDYVAYHKSLAKMKSMRQKSALKSVFGTELGYTLYQYSEAPTWYGFVQNLRSKDTLTAYQKTTIDGVESDRIVTEQSIFGAFQSIIGALMPQDQIQADSKSLETYGYYSTEEILASNGYKNYGYKDLVRNVLEFTDFFEDPNNFTGSEKRMVLGYVKCPHVPFAFDEYGQIRSFGQRMNWNNPEYYLGQYIFMSKHVANIFKTIISADPESIIIVMGDHGVRSHNQGFCDISKKDDCWIYLACYYQGEQIDMEELSPINLLRLVASNLGADLPPVQDYVTKSSKDDLSDVVFPR